MYDINELLSKDLIENDLKGKSRNQFSDENFWMIPEGTSVVRLLPRMESRIPYLTSYTHRFSSGDENIVVDCLQTFKKKCPVCKRGWELYNSEVKSEVDLSKKVYRVERYIYNVYIVNDAKNPENNGQIKLVSFGVKLNGNSKHNGVISTAFSSEDFGSSIFDISNGYDLVIMRKGQGMSSDYTGTHFKTKKYKIYDFSEIKDKLINIDELFVAKEKSVDEIKKIFYFLGFNKGPIAEVREVTQKQDVVKETKKIVEVEKIKEEENEDIDMSIEEVDEDPSTDEALDDLMKELDLE